MSKVKPSVPSSISLAAGGTLSFPKNDEEFHLNDVIDIESFEVGSEPIIIPIIDTGKTKSAWRGAGITIGDNNKTLRDWFRDDRSGVLLWDKNMPIGQELGSYNRS